LTGFSWFLCTFYRRWSDNWDKYRNRSWTDDWIPGTCRCRNHQSQTPQ